VHKIDLSEIDAVASTWRDDAFRLLGEGAVFTAAGQLPYRYEADGLGGQRTILEGHIGGSLAPDVSIELSGRMPARRARLEPCWRPRHVSAPEWILKETAVRANWHSLRRTEKRASSNPS
jgi:hypothetical protein